MAKKRGKGGLREHHWREKLGQKPGEVPARILVTFVGRNQVAQSNGVSWRV
jgi:hypothetical protein